MKQTCAFLVLVAALGMSSCTTLGPYDTLIHDRAVAGLRAGKPLPDDQTLRASGLVDIKVENGVLTGTLRDDSYEPDPEVTVYFEEPGDGSRVAVAVALTCTGDGWCPIGCYTGRNAIGWLDPIGLMRPHDDDPTCYTVARGAIPDSEERCDTVMRVSDFDRLASHWGSFSSMEALEQRWASVLAQSGKSGLERLGREERIFKVINYSEVGPVGHKVMTIANQAKLTAAAARVIPNEALLLPADLQPAWVEGNVRGMWKVVKEVERRLAAGTVEGLAITREKLWSRLSEQLLKAGRRAIKEGNRATAVAYMELSNSYAYRAGLPDPGSISSYLRGFATEIAQVSVRVSLQPDSHTYKLRNSWTDHLQASTAPDAIQISYGPIESSVSGPHFGTELVTETTATEETVVEDSLDLSGSIERIDARLAAIEREAEGHASLIVVVPSDHQPGWVWKQDPDHGDQLVATRNSQRTGSAEWRIGNARAAIRKLRNEFDTLLAERERLVKMSAPKVSKVVGTTTTTKRVGTRKWKVHAKRKIIATDPQGGTTTEVQVLDATWSDTGDLPDRNAVEKEIVQWMDRDEHTRLPLRTAVLPLIRQRVERYGATKDPVEAALARSLVGLEGPPLDAEGFEAILFKE
jgi:hypothetical protein